MALISCSFPHLPQRELYKKQLASEVFEKVSTSGLCCGLFRELQPLATC